MAQLDKTFPTNDCSMCIESPKLVEFGRHPNIEIMTYTEVDSVEGEAGDFKVTLIRSRDIFMRANARVVLPVWSIALSSTRINTIRKYRRIKPSTYIFPRRFRSSPI